MVKLTIKEIERELEKLENASEEEAKEVLTEEQKNKIKLLREETRKKNIEEFFKLLTNRDITPEEYRRYIDIYENPRTRNGYNLKNFIEGDDGSVFKKEDGATNEEII